MAATADEIPGIFCRVALRGLPDHTFFSPTKLADFIAQEWLKTRGAIRNLYRYVEHAEKQAPIQNYIDQLVDIFKTPDMLEFYCKHPVDLVFEVEESYELRDCPDEIEKQLVETSA